MEKTIEKNLVDESPLSLNVINKILSFVHERRYPSAERLPSERDFAERLNTSRAAVREALAALESMRIIERRPNSGIFLRKSDDSSIEALVLHAASGLPFKPEETASVFEGRRILEVQAVRIACAQRTAEDIQDLRQILDATKKRLRKSRRLRRRMKRSIWRSFPRRRTEFCCGSSNHSTGCPRNADRYILKIMSAVCAPTKITLKYSKRLKGAARRRPRRG
jgi:DNA-binding FadR family transcriptional regulator